MKSEFYSPGLRGNWINTALSNQCKTKTKLFTETAFRTGIKKEAKCYKVKTTGLGLELGFGKKFIKTQPQMF